MAGALCDLDCLLASSQWLQRSVGSCRGRMPTRCSAQASPKAATPGWVRSGTKPGANESSWLAAAWEKGIPVLVVKKGKARLFWEGAPTVYAGALEQINSKSPPRTGDTALLVDAAQSPIGWGVYNSDSMFTLRILKWASESGEASFSVKSVIEERLREAVELRKALGLPSSETTIYRLVNSEGDRLSGLVVDVYGDCLVAASSAAWVELQRAKIEAVLKEQTGARHIVWRPSKDILKLEGLEFESGPSKEGEPAASASSPSHVTACENGVQYRIDLRHGQKTGFYADQRDSRALIKTLAEGRRVLDLCCYTGGFALSAAAGGAAEATGVDSSAAAVSLAAENAGFLGSEKPVEFQKAGVEDFMKAAAAEGKTYDIVILDPPKLAPNKAALARAKRKYTSLNAAALRLVAAGGLLMTCSCSGAVAQGEGLLPLVKDAAVLAGKKLTLLRSAGAALDHPLDPACPEGSYLTNLLFRVS